MSAAENASRTDSHETTAATAASARAAPESCPEPKVADVIVEHMLQVADVFHDTERGTTYATVENGARPETLRIRSPRFLRFIAHEVRRAQGTTVNRSAMEAVVTTLEAIAMFDRPKPRRVHVRVGEENQRLYIDLAAETGAGVEVCGGSWRVLDRSPLRFLRPDTMESLPTPIRGGSVEELRSFVSLSDADFLLLIGWLLAALRPDRPCPVLVLTGHQGSGKSSLTRMIRMLIDPNAVPLRSPPKSEEHLLISALNARVVALENVSLISWEMSDALCRLVTGGGLAKRTLFTDEGETTLGAMRAIVLNGIGSIVTRPDLAERALVLVVRRMADAQRKTEAALWKAFEEARPRIFGALLDGVAAAHAGVSGVTLENPPRMADFAAWVAAAAPGLGVAPEAMLSAYSANRARAVETALEASPVATALRTLLRLKEARDGWQGTPRQLHQKLGSIVGDDVARSRYWPKLPNLFTAQLRRDDTFLQAVGVEVTFSFRAHARWVCVRLRETPAGSSVSCDGADGADGLDGAPSADVWVDLDPEEVGTRTGAREAPARDVGDDYGGERDEAER